MALYILTFNKGLFLRSRFFFFKLLCGILRELLVASIVHSAVIRNYFASQRERISSQHELIVLYTEAVFSNVQ